MKKIVLLFVLFLSIFRLETRADEGMWIPMLVNRLNYVDMQKMGLKLTAEEIYSANHSSLKDAVVIFGRGCTGEIISDKGLLITNHHCGYGSIQSVSSVEKDFLTNGFWAGSFQDEIPVPGLTVQFLVRMADVTKDMLNGVSREMSEKQRNEILATNRKNVVAEAIKDTHYNAVVKDYFEGNEFYLLVYETFKDIRLVGTPPEVIGKFGADTDNWMWPRHTGDFSMFRVYANADNQPADFSLSNVPYHPKQYLPISINGVKKGDFSMIMGNPGSTDRYLTSWGVDLAINETNSTIVKIREEKLRIMKEGMDASEKVRLQYASKYAGTANYWKYFIGQTQGLKRLKVADKKRRLEQDFTTWIETDPKAMADYGQALPLISDAYKALGKYNLMRWYYAEGVMRGSEILGFASKFGQLKELLLADKTDQAAIDKEVAKLREGLDDYFKNYNAAIDQKLLGSMMQMLHKDVPAEQQPELLKKIAEKNNDDFDDWAEDLFEESRFASKESVLALLAHPKAKSISKDPAYELVVAFNTMFETYKTLTADANANLQRGNRIFVAGLQAMQPNKVFYPNANFSLRLTYGTVQDYYPADAVHYDYTTTLQGVMDKEDPSVKEFTVPTKLKEIYKARDFGPYGNPDGSMTVNFLTTHDITGGNSGSPVIDGEGRLIGLAFDGNWEAMSGDIAFEPELQRTINVDIRYVLLIIDKLAGADNLIKEMTIIKN